MFLMMVLLYKVFQRCFDSGDDNAMAKRTRKRKAAMDSGALGGREVDAQAPILVLISPE